MSFDWEAFGERLGQKLKTHVAAAVEPLAARITELEARKPERGEKGEPGLAGKDAPALTRDQIVEALLPPEGLLSPLKSVVAQYLTEFPPTPGRDGRDGTPGRDGKDGEKAKDGAPGRDGKDGLGFDDLEVLFDGQREFKFAFVRGDQRKEFPFSVPFIIDRGVWKEAEYKHGDAVTWGGSLWIAQKDTTTKPDTKDSDWRLSVKRGRDGKDGKQGPEGKQGPTGAPGRDFTGTFR